MTGLEQILEDIVRRVVREELAAAGRSAQPGGLVSVAEYARQRSISPATVRAAIKAGRLGVVRNGRAWRVRADEEIADDKPTENDAAFALRVLRGRA